MTERTHPPEKYPRGRPAGPPAAIALALALAVASAAGCNQPAAMGEPNSLILVVPDSLWALVGEEAEPLLEPTFYTTREDQKFLVTQVDPLAPDIGKLQMWRQVIVFAPPGDERLEKIARKADRTSLQAPEIFGAGNVWARGQVATAVVLEPGREAESMLEQLPALVRRLDDDYRAYVLARMFVSGADTALAEALGARLGFSAKVPKVYEFAFRDGDIVIIRNDNPDPSVRIRSILVQRVATATEAIGEATGQPAPLTAETVYAWRESIDDVQYNVPQSIIRAEGSERTFELAGAPVLEVRGVWNDVWKDEGSFPAGGPFITRGMRCPGYTVYVDAWLYSPSARRSKYEYMLQLEEILNSFRCSMTS